jgi:hypothetical protein
MLRDVPGGGGGGSQPLVEHTRNIRRRLPLDSAAEGVPHFYHHSVCTELSATQCCVSHAPHVRISSTRRLLRLVSTGYDRNVPPCTADHHIRLTTRQADSKHAGVASLECTLHNLFNCGG